MIKQEFSEWQHSYSNKFIINKGISNSVETYYEEFPYSKFPINKSNIKDIEIKINCTYELDSPLLENTLVGNICGSVNDIDIFELDIYTKKNIPKKNTLIYINTFLKNYCIYLESLFT